MNNQTNKKSVYEIACENGFKGTPAQYLEYIEHNGNKTFKDHQQHNELKDHNS